MRTFKEQKYYSLFFAFFSCLLFIYVSLRAFFINITHDEAYSFHNVKNFWYAEFFCTGNSHWFNSLAIKCALITGFENPLSLRWLSLISFAGVLICAFVWIKSIEKPYLKFAAFCFIFLNPYLIDYFSLARGYAPALLFQALSILFFTAGLKAAKRNYLLWSLVFSGLSAISNFGFVYFFAAFTFIYFYKIYYNKSFAFLKEKNFYVDFFISAVFASLVLRAFGFIIHCSNDLSGAGSYAFSDVFSFFIDGSAYHKINFVPENLQLYSLSFFILILVAGIAGILKNKNNPLYFYSSALLLIMLVTIVFNNICFGIVFPSYRSALIFVIPVVVSLICFLDFVFKNMPLKKTVFGLTSLFLICNFYKSVNLKYCFDYREQADSKEIFDRLASVAAKRVGMSPELYGVYLNYYSITKNHNYPYTGNMIETRTIKNIPAPKNKLNEFDYLIIFPPYNMSYYKNSNVKVEVMEFYETTGTVVAKVISK